VQGGQEQAARPIAEKAEKKGSRTITARVGGVGGGENCPGRVAKKGHKKGVSLEISGKGPRVNGKKKQRLTNGAVTGGGKKTGKKKWCIVNACPQERIMRLAANKVKVPDDTWMLG